MAKVIMTTNGITHFYGWCFNCDFNKSIGDGLTRGEVRKKLKQHVLETGHHVSIEKVTSTHFELEAT